MLGINSKAKEAGARMAEEFKARVKPDTVTFLFGLLIGFVAAGLLMIAGSAR